jgi:hypothetical protein
LIWALQLTIKRLWTSCQPSKTLKIKQLKFKMSTWWTSSLKASNSLRWSSPDAFLYRTSKQSIKIYYPLSLKEVQ